MKNLFSSIASFFGFHDSAAVPETPQKPKKKYYHTKKAKTTATPSHEKPVVAEKGPAPKITAASKPAMTPKAAVSKKATPPTKTTSTAKEDVKKATGTCTNTNKKRTQRPKETVAAKGKK